MWQCAKCRETVGDSFDVCWNCGTSGEGVEDPNFLKADDGPAKLASQSSAAETIQADEEPGANPLVCVRCNRELDYVGTKASHEGTRWGAFGDLGELFVNKQRFDVYCCPRCGRVELFIDGVGEQFRPR